VNQPTYTTEGIIISHIKYGETSIIVQAFTELFGLQSYIIKGIRTNNKKGGSKFNYFFPGSCLSMVVYHNPHKQLQFIKEYGFSFLSTQSNFSVIKNAIVVYMVELLKNCLKQPENNPSLFYLVKKSLQLVNNESQHAIANLSIWYSLQVANHLGFGLDPTETPTEYLDLQEGTFTNQLPMHAHFLQGIETQIMANFCLADSWESIIDIKLNKHQRQQFLQYIQIFFQLHVEGFGVLKSLSILGEIL
jgi:DNA repair protein RecO (recombination protein O)